MGGWGETRRSSSRLVACANHCWSSCPSIASRAGYFGTSAVRTKWTINGGGLMTVAPCLLQDLSRCARRSGHESDLMELGTAPGQDRHLLCDGDQFVPQMKVARAAPYHFFSRISL